MKLIKTEWVKVPTYKVTFVKGQYQIYKDDTLIATTYKYAEVFTLMN